MMLRIIMCTLWDCIPIAETFSIFDLKISLKQRNVTVIYYTHREALCLHLFLALQSISGRLDCLFYMNESPRKVFIVLFTRSISVLNCAIHIKCVR
jgi:hypothetical protein